MPQDLTDDKSTLVQVMAWCRQATSHYLNQRWPRSLTSYGVTRPQWVKCHKLGKIFTDCTGKYLPSFNTLRPRQNGRFFPDNIFKRIFLNDNVIISIKISLKFVPMGPINNIPALVQIMAWRQPGDKPLSEPMMVSLLTHKCVTRPQWVNCQMFIGPASQTTLIQALPNSVDFKGIKETGVWVQDQAAGELLTGFIRRSESNR